MDNIILQLREQDTNTTNYQDGDYEVILSEPIVLENNDTLRLANAFIDTRDISTQYINIAEDTEINMSFYLYTTNHCGTYKIHGTDGFIFPDSEGGGPSYVGYNKLAPASYLRQDGDPYFLCTITCTSDYLSEITQVQFLPSNSGAAWGDVTVVYTYPAANLVEPVAPETIPHPPAEPYPVHTISIYIPLQPAGTESYYAEVNFSLINVKRVLPVGTPPVYELLTVDEAFTLKDSSKPLSEAGVRPLGSTFQLIGFGLSHEPQAGFPSPVAPNVNTQLILNPVQNQMSIVIPKGKYIPADLCKFINDSVVNFRSNDGIGIPKDPTTLLPSAPTRQRLPFAANPLDKDSVVFGDLAGLPTFTQSNFIEEPPPPAYIRTDGVANWHQELTPITLGQHMYSNYNPSPRGDGNGAEIGNSNIFVLNNFYKGYQPDPPITAHGIYIPWTESGSFVGASQFSLEYDTSTNKFGFDYLHTPLYVGGGAKDTGAADPNAGDIANYFIIANARIVRKLEVGSTNPDKTFDGAYPSIGMYAEAENINSQSHPLYKYCGNNGGICFTSLTPHSFWHDTLGFNLEPMEFGPTGNITKQGIISSHKFIDLGTAQVSDGSQQRRGFNCFNTTLNTLGLQGISPQMPVIGFNIGHNATSGAINLESAVAKAVIQNPDGAWWLVQPKIFGGTQSVETGVNDSQNPDLDADGAAWNVSSKNIIGAATTRITAQDPKLLDIVDTGYYLVSVDTKVENKMINSNESLGTIQGVVNRYYSVNSFTSSDGSDIVYTHEGEPTMITSLRVRILNPDLTPASVGEDNTIFISIEKSKEEDITSTIELQKIQESKKK